MSEDVIKNKKVIDTLAQIKYLSNKLLYDNGEMDITEVRDCKRKLKEAQATLKRLKR